jgi:putative tryptophan/tyrosine transport system substrate-binding protein
MRWRRSLLVFTFGILASAAFTQPNKMPVVGVLMVGAGPDDPIFDSMRAGMLERGYVQNRDYRIEHRTARGQVERLPQLARELVDLKVDVIIVSLEPVVRILKGLTSTIPIVIVSYDHDPVASGFAVSLSRPGGNVTGIASRIPDLVGKRLEILKETLPGTNRVAVFWDAFSRGQLDNLATAARALGIELERIELTGNYDIDAAYTLAEQRKCAAAFMLLSPHFFVRRMEFEPFALKHKLPTAHYDETVVKRGGLMSYGPSNADLYKRSGYFIDRIFKGTPPKELPIEQEERLKLVVNQKTAKLLGIKIPESILLRADEVIR